MKASLDLDSAELLRARDTATIELEEGQEVQDFASGGARNGKQSRFIWFESVKQPEWKFQNNPISWQFKGTPPLQEIVPIIKEILQLSLL